jgi:hypothetical protein
MKSVKKFGKLASDQVSEQTQCSYLLPKKGFENVPELQSK